MTKAPSFSAIARLITGGQQPPSWLEPTLGKLAGYLADRRRNEDWELRPTGMRSKLDCVRLHAAALLEILDEGKRDRHRLKRGAQLQQIRAVIDGSDPIPPGIWQHLVEGLNYYERRVTERLNKISPKDKKAPAASRNNPDAMCLCAMIVRESWKIVRGTPPKPGSKDAAAAAEALWRISGNYKSDRRRPGTTATRWRRHFERAVCGAAVIEHERKRVKRLLKTPAETAPESHEITLHNIPL